MKYPIYKAKGKYYQQLKPVGSWKFKGREHYALWQPVKKFLWWYIPNGREFWLDMYGFEKVKE